MIRPAILLPENFTGEGFPASVDIAIVEDTGDETLTVLNIEHDATLGMGTMKRIAERLRQTNLNLAGGRRKR